MVEIVEYRSEWPNEFAEIASKIQEALGLYVVRIDHIGSTSVPGLASKDVIDLQITLRDLEAPIQGPLEFLGYAEVSPRFRDHVPPGYQGPDTDWGKRYFRAPHGQRRTHTHVRQLGSPNQRFALLFRDYLRTHPASAAAYAELKRRLAASLSDPSEYPDVKDPACDLIYFAAEDWALATGWS